MATGRHPTRAVLNPVVSTAACGSWGIRGEFVAMRMRSWRNSARHLASWAIPNGWLSELGLLDLASVPTGALPQVT